MISSHKKFVALILTVLVIISVSLFQPASKVLATQEPSAAAQSVPSMSMSTIGEGLESSLSVNPYNSSNIIVTGSPVSLLVTGDNMEIARVSVDGGQTWSEGNASFRYVSQAVNGGLRYYDQTAVFDSNGQAYVGNLNNGTMTYLFKSTDGYSYNLTSPFLKPTDNLVYYGNGTIVHPCGTRDFDRVVVDASPTSPYVNNVYVVSGIGAQLTTSNCQFGETFVRSTDGGRTWRTGIWFSYRDMHSIASPDRGVYVAPDGTVFLAGWGNPGRAPNCQDVGSYVVNVLKSTDGGASFPQESCAENEAGFTRVQASWHADEVSVASTGAGIVYVVFYALNVTLGTAHLYSVVSHDGGVSWSSKVRVDDAIVPDSGPVASTGIFKVYAFSLSQTTGRLDVAWLDYRNDGGNQTLADLYYTYSTSGLSWNSNLRLTTQGPYYICAASSSTVCADCGCPGNDYIWITNSDTPSSDQAIIVASMGKTACGNHCADTTLYTRLVTVAFPIDSSVGGSLIWGPPPITVYTIMFIALGSMVVFGFAYGSGRVVGKVLLWHRRLEPDPSVDAPEEDMLVRK